MDQNGVGTIEQIQQELFACRQSLKEAIDGIPLQAWDIEDMLKDALIPTIDEVLANIPSEEELTLLLKDSKSIQQKRNAVLHYKGDYELVKAFKSNIENTKEEAVASYYLLSKVNPFNPKALLNKALAENSLVSWVTKINELNTKRPETNVLRSDFRQHLKSMQIKGKNTLSPNDVMVHVIFYDSCNREKQNQFICHGGVLLSELRDRFYCLIEELQPKNPKNGSFFFINNNFYNDSRLGREDISKEIINVARVNKVDYSCFNMETTRLKNLRVEIGRPYVWRHLRGCDHMVVFSEVRLYDSDIDISLRSEYPINVFQKKINRRRCEGCKKHFAKIVAQVDRNKNGEDLYLCAGCHEDIHLQEVEGAYKKMPKETNMIISKYLHD